MMLTRKLSASLILGFILGLGMSMIQDGNPHMDAELAINTIHIIYDHIQVTFYMYLSEEATIYNSGLHNQYERLSYKASQMASWCLLNRTLVTRRIAMEIVHVKVWTPCGYHQLVLGSSNKMFQMILHIHNKFHLQIYFLVFEFKVSMIDCQKSSTLILCQAKVISHETYCIKRWTYCGHLRPWRKTLESNSAIIRLDERNDRHRFNLTYYYTSLERKISNIFVKYERHDTETPQTGLANYLEFSHNNISNFHQWLIIVAVGDEIRFSALDTNYFSGTLDIYSGESDHHLLSRTLSFGMLHKKRLNVSSNYFSANVRYYAIESYQNAYNLVYFLLSYNKQQVSHKEISSNTTITITNKGNILYSVYSIQFTGNDNFPNVSLTIRRFTGWNGKDCHYGGYALIQHIALPHLSSKSALGPFCSKSLSSTPFIGTDGPKHIILSGHQYDLIIYAFGPLFEIDIDLVIRCSKCEGLLEPLLMYTSEMKLSNQSFNITHTRRVIGSIHYQNCYILYSEQKIDGRMMLFVEFMNISKCIVFQSISLFYDGAIRYYFKGFMNIQVTAYNGLKEEASERYLMASVFNIGRTLASFTNASFSMAYKRVASVAYKSMVFNCHLDFYISIQIKAIEHIRFNVCTRITQENDTSPGQLFHHFEITNLCGVIYSMRHLLQRYMYTFSILYTYADERVFMYLIFNTTCGLNASGSEQNYLTILTDKSSMTHTVKVWKNILRINHYHMPLIFIYENILGCEFSVNYNLQHFYVWAFPEYHYQSATTMIRVK